ncbi:MAG: flagellar hook-length control protein FliK [Lachnospiraceae bacterium]|nr:flagellar hook-length control protein FliK [Lachnospiraceae bacterium]
MNSIDKRITSSSAGDIKSLRAASTGTGTSGATTVTNGNAIRQTAQITGNMLLAQMQPGSTFSGDIIDVRGYAIKILLGDEKTLDATTADSKNLNIGDHITFNVSSNDGKTVMIKPIKINNFNTNVLLKALEAAEVPTNDRNIKVVKTMMQNEMSIDKQSLSEMIKKVDTLEAEEPQDVVMMERHGIPLSKENVQQFAAYRNCEHRIMAQVDTVATQIPEILEEALQSNDSQTVASLGKEIIRLLNDDVDTTATYNKMNTSEDGTVKVIQKENSYIKEQAVENNSEDEAFLEKLNIKDEGVVLSVNTYNDSKIKLTTEQVLGKLNNLNSEELKGFLVSDEFKDYIKDKVEKNFELNVNRLGDNETEVKENVKKLYERLDKKTELLMNLLENSGNKDNILYQTTSNMRNNMQFMQDLSQMAAYIQLPVKLNESKAHGDLYVFNRKNGKPVNKDSITAFLHLDLEHLGATDVDVLLEGKTLKTQFSLKDITSVKLVEEHLDELKERLTKRGYSVTLNALVMPDSSNENAFMNMLENDKPQISIKRYSFDVRA